MATGYYDRFRARVMFTITDLRKRVVGFGGRVLGEGTPKYLNSPDTPLFKKGQTLFAFDVAREAVSRTKTVIVVEGYFDAIALHQAGLTHTVATLGTALTPEQSRCAAVCLESRAVVRSRCGRCACSVARVGSLCQQRIGRESRDIAGRRRSRYVRPKRRARGVCPFGRTGAESAGFCP